MFHSSRDAAEIGCFLDGDFGPFHRIFLFIATHPEGSASIARPVLLANREGQM
jgi:hypothetical protein